MGSPTVRAWPPREPGTAPRVRNGTAPADLVGSRPGVRRSNIGRHVPRTAMIRAYADTDLEPVLDAWYEASLIAHSFLPAEFFVTERALIAERWLPASEAYVCELDGHVVGFISLVGNEVGGFFVHPDHQGRGAGQALMDHARQLRSTLELDVFEENLIGRRFYDAYGFVLVETRDDTESGHPQLRLRLS